MTSLSLKEWQSIMRAVDSIEKGDARQIKNEKWTVYLTATCIRIDIHLQGE